MITRTKIIIWDLGGTLIRRSPLTMARALGCLDVFVYRMLYWRDGYDLKTRLYEILFDVSGSQQSTQVRDEDGTLVPPVVSDWLAGRVTSQEVLHKALDVMMEQDRAGALRDAREKRLLIGLLNTIFIPANFVRTLTPISAAVHLLKKCVHQHYTMMIGSNFDKESFDLMRRTPRFSALFNYIFCDGVIVSGHIGITKPSRAFFEHILQAYALDPAECVFVDDQKENVIAAESCGIVSFHLDHTERHPYDLVYNKLQKYTGSWR